MLNSTRFYEASSSEDYWHKYVKSDKHGGTFKTANGRIVAIMDVFEDWIPRLSRVLS